jgi:hypothetical protein
MQIDTDSGKFTITSAGQPRPKPPPLIGLEVSIGGPDILLEFRGTGGAAAWESLARALSAALEQTRAAAAAGGEAKVAVPLAALLPPDDRGGLG